MSKNIFGFSEIDVNNQNEIMVVKTGKWNHPLYGEFNITPKTLREFKENFDSNTRGVDIGIDIEHSSYEGYVGWFKDLFIKGKALYAIIEWTTKGAELLKDKTYKYFSPELAFEYEDMETHEKYNNVLIGGGITNRPYFKGLKPLLASESNINEDGDNFNLFYNSDNMDDEKKVETPEEEKVETPTEDEKKVEVPAEESKEDAPKEEVEKTEEAPTETPTEVEASEASVIKLSEENAELKKRLRASEIEKQVDSIVCAEGATNLPFLPSARGKIAKFFEGLTDDQIGEFNEIAKLVVKGDLFKEHGKDAAEAGIEPDHTLNANLVEEAKKLSEKEGIEFEEALRKLGKQYKSIKDV